MDIDGLGKSIIERFYELGWLKNIADIYRLDYEKNSKTGRLRREVGTKHESLH